MDLVGASSNPQGENLQVHACFRTTHAAEGLQPEPTILRQLRCQITRDDPTGGVPANAVGVYYLSSTEDIGGAPGQDADIDINVGSDQGGLIDIEKIANFVWRMTLWIGDGGGGAGVLIPSDLMGAGNTGSAVNVTIRRVEAA
jgi:hypothetical protein